MKLSHQKRSLIMLMFQLWDAAIVCIALYVSVKLTNNSSQWLFPSLFSKPIIFYIIGLTIVWHATLKLNGLYDSWRLDRTMEEYVRLLWSTILIVGLVSIIGILSEIEFIDKEFILYFSTLTAFLTLSTRLLIRFVLFKIRMHNHNINHILIIGCSARGQYLYNELKQQPWLGYRVIGFVDTPHDTVDKAIINNLKAPLLCDLKHLSELLSTVRVDEVFITLPVKSCYDYIQQILTECEEQGIDVKIISDFFDMNYFQSKVDYVGYLGTISLTRRKYSNCQLCIKRWFDIIVSSIILLLLMPILIVVAILIKTTSQGPVIFIQDRVGLNKKHFKMFKFRTMDDNAEAQLESIEDMNEASGPVFKIKDDPRITKVGKFLRSTSIDELPQLFNVLKGEMSLVGPRPLPIRDVERFDKNWQRRRFSVLPGITCTWQISGRSNISFDKWMEMDMDYIDNWSLKLDLIILLRTFPAIFKRDGAY